MRGPELWSQQEGFPLLSMCCLELIALWTLGRPPHSASSPEGSPIIRENTHWTPVCPELSHCVQARRAIAH